MAQKPNYNGVSACRGCAKLWVVDVLNLPINPQCQQFYVFRCKNINKVDVCGVVTECSQSGTRTNFTVDDTTGSIQCSLNYARLRHTGKRGESVPFENFKKAGADDQLAKALSNISSCAKERRPYQGEFQVGDCIRVCGFITDYYEDRRLNAFVVSKPLFEPEEISRRCQMVLLYKRVYGTEEKGGKTPSPKCLPTD